MTDLSSDGMVLTTDYTLNVEGIFEEDASVSASGLSFKDLLTDLLAGTSVTVVMTTNSSGDQKLTGAAFFSSLSLSAPNTLPMIVRTMLAMSPIPLTFGRVIVRSAVGSATVRVVSKSSAVAPSKTTPLPLISGDVRVLFVRVCVPDVVATVESIATVTAEDPS